MTIRPKKRSGEETDESVIPTEIIQSLRAAVIILDLQGKITHFNRAAEDLSGYRAEEVHGRKPWQFLIDGEDARLSELAFENLRSSGLQTEMEVVCVGRNGQKRIVQWSNAPVLDEAGTLKWIIDTLVDLTEERKIESQLETAKNALEIERRSAQFLSETSYRISQIELDQERRVHAIARMAVPILADWSFVVIPGAKTGHELKSAFHWDPAKEDAIRSFLRWTDRLSTVDLLAKARGGIVANGEPFWPETTREREILTELGWSTWRCFPLPIASHSRSGALFLAAGKENREKLHGQDRIALEFARRAGPLLNNALLYERAREATRLRDDFLAIAAHELRTPIAPLLLQVGLIRHHLESGDFAAYPKAADLKRILNNSTEQLQDLARLIENMMDASRISLNQFALRCEETDLAECVRNVLKRFTDQIRSSGCVVTVRASSGVKGLWDPAKTEQVITNLFTNAMKYGRGKPIEIEVTASPNRATLKVRDHGIGISLDEQARLFTRFGRVPSLRKIPGFGLGLYICRQIVLAHHGTIRVESEFGRGATFIVDLPVETLEKPVVSGEVKIGIEGALRRPTT